MNDLNKTNIPIGLDLNNFIPGGRGGGMPSGGGMPGGNPKIPKISEVEDPQIIESVAKQAPNFKIILQNRIKNLMKVSDTWAQGRNKSDAFDVANHLYDLAILNDLYNFAFIKTELNYIDIRTDDLIIIFPSIHEMCSSKYDMYFKNGVLTAWKLLKLYKDIIIDTKTQQYLRGVDISKEDKIKRYDIIINDYDKLRTNSNLNAHLKGKPIEGLDLQAFYAELCYFLNKCKGN